MLAAKFKVKDEPFVLEYFLEKKANTWKIYDISFDDIRYSVNINEQLDAFLKEKNFNALLDKLRKRSAEIEKS